MATFTRDDITEDMPVYSADGHKLGTVYIIETTGFHVEKGFFFPKDYLARFEDIKEIDDSRNIVLSRKKDELLEGGAAWDQSAIDEADARDQGTWPPVEDTRAL